MLRKKFGRVAANVQKFRMCRTVSKALSDRSTTKDHASEVEEGFTLDELLQSADLSEAFDFTDSFTEKDWTTYLPTETVAARRHFSNKDVSPQGGHVQYQKVGSLKVPRHYEHK